MNTAIRNNMPDSELAVNNAKADSTKAAWSTLESMLATVIDEIRLSRWAYAQTHSESTVPKPDPVPRPGLPARAGRLIRLEDAQKIDPRLRGLSEREAQEMLDRMTGRGR